MENFDDLKCTIQTVIVILKHEDEGDNSITSDNSHRGIFKDEIFRYMPYKMMYQDNETDGFEDCSNSLGNYRNATGGVKKRKKHFRNCSTIKLLYQGVKYVLKISHHKIHICGVKDQSQITDLLNYFFDNITLLQNMSMEIATNIFTAKYLAELNELITCWYNGDDYDTEYQHLQFNFQAYTDKLNDLRVRILALLYLFRKHFRAQEPVELFRELDKVKYRLTEGGQQTFYRVMSIHQNYTSIRHHKKKQDFYNKYQTEIDLYKHMGQMKFSFGQKYFDRLTNYDSNFKLGANIEQISMFDLIKQDDEKLSIFNPDIDLNYLRLIYDFQVRLYENLKSDIHTNIIFKTDNEDVDKMIEYFNNLARDFNLGNINQFYKYLNSFCTGVRFLDDDLIIDCIMSVMVNYRYHIKSDDRIKDLIKKFENTNFEVRYNNMINNCINIYLPYTEDEDRQAYIRHNSKSRHCNVFNLYPSGKYVMQSSPNITQARDAYNQFKNIIDN